MISSQTARRDGDACQIHDPTTKNRQGNHRGTSYRSGIYYLSDERRRWTSSEIHPPGATARVRYTAP